MLGSRRHQAQAAHQSRVDAIVAAAKARSATPAARGAATIVRALPPLRASDALLERRLEEELRYAQRLVDNMGDSFADDPVLLARHAQALQGFDHLSQLLGHLALVIGSADKDAALARIGMAELKARLSRPGS